MITKKTYQAINTFTREGYLIFFCLIFLITAKPILKIIVHLIDEEYEMCESFEEENSEEKEMPDETEEKEQKLYCLNCSSSESYSQMANLCIKTGKYFNVHKHLTEFNFDVLLPPPEVL